MLTKYIFLFKTKIDIQSDNFSSKKDLKYFKHECFSFHFCLKLHFPNSNVH